MLKLIDLKKQLVDLEKFINSGTIFTKDQLYNWLTRCVALFSYIGLNEVIIKLFLDSFKPLSKSSTYSLDDIFDRDPISIGPFKKQNESTPFYELPKSYFGDIKIEEMYPIKIAFESATYMLEQKADEERLVSKSIVNILSENEKYLHVVSSLNALQKAYENKDSEKLSSSAITLLDSILNLEPTLKAKKEISQKLRFLNTNSLTREKFGISKEVIYALDNSRIIRNYKSIHKSLPLKYDIPFLVGTSYAYLVLFFLEVVLSTGKLEL